MANELTVLLSKNDKSFFDKNRSVQELNAVLYPVLGQLLYMNENFEISGGLVEKFVWLPSEQSYLLRLRDGLKFHSGRLATATDLEFSILRGFLRPSGKFHSAFFSNIEGIESLVKAEEFESGSVSGVKIVDDMSVKVKLKRPNPSFLHSIARTYFSLVPREALQSDYETWKTMPIGAGDFSIDEKVSQEKMSLSRTKQSPGEIDRITFTANGAEAIDINLTEAMRASEREITSKRATSLTGIYFNFNNPLGKNKMFREAIAYAVKRAELVEGVASYDVADQFLASHFWGRSSDSRAYSVEAAKKVLSKVDHDFSKVTLKIPVFNSFYGDVEKGKYLVFLKSQLEKVGVSVEFVDSQTKRFKGDETEPVFRIISLGADVADPLVLFGLMRGQSPLSPFIPPRSDEFEAHFIRASEAGEMEAKVKAIKEFSSLFVREAYMVPLFERKLITRINVNTVSSFGRQDGGLTLHLPLVELKNDDK